MGPGDRSLRDPAREGNRNPSILINHLKVPHKCPHPTAYDVSSNYLLLRHNSNMDFSDSSDRLRREVGGWAVATVMSTGGAARC